jgi:hypothetical protein
MDACENMGIERAVPHRFVISCLLACAAACGSQRGCQSSTAEPDSAAPPASPAASSLSAQPACPRFARGRVTGRIEASAIVEASGLVASRNNPGVLWVHNDSGNAEQLFALTVEGKTLAKYSLANAACIDWEDIAIGSGPDGLWYLYVGDTGTNQAARSPVVIYRIEEPRVALDQSPVEAALERVEMFELEYPDGQSYDSETLLVDPTSGDLVLVTKTTSGSSGVYLARAPLLAGARRTLELVATLRTQLDAGRGSERTTAGDISADGRWILIKTYTHAYLWHRAPGTSVAAALSALPCEVPLAPEPQGEAVGFAADGKGYFTLSEGEAQPIYFFERKD